jgi:predicted nucleotidyltransferase component of viral defense system
MIPAGNILAWGRSVPWGDERQIEQDLIISRALVDIFNDRFLRAEVRFRGGTALNKLHFPAPLRYSEDIDLTKTREGAIGPVVNRIQDLLRPWLGNAAFKKSAVTPKLFFETKAETSGARIRLKVEINARECIAYDGDRHIPLTVQNSWFSGTAQIATFSNEELLATKLRALLQRDKGRDLIDLTHAVRMFGDLNLPRVVELFGTYLAAAEQHPISRAEAESRMFEKYGRRKFLADVPPLLAASESEKFDETSAKQAFEVVFREFIERLPGQPWALSGEMIAKFGLSVAGATDGIR